MSWMGGVEMAEALWATVREKLPEADRQAVAREWVEWFEHRGCDWLMGTQLGDDAGIIHPEEGDDDSSSRWAWTFGVEEEDPDA